MIQQTPRRRCACAPSCALTNTEAQHRRHPPMSNQQPAYRAFTVIKRGEGQDDYWLPIGAAFPHQSGDGFNVILQALLIAMANASSCFVLQKTTGMKPSVHSRPFARKTIVGKG